jgi:hypothetical protein
MIGVDDFLYASQDDLQALWQRAGWRTNAATGDVLQLRANTVNHAKARDTQPWVNAKDAGGG